MVVCLGKCGTKIMETKRILILGGNGFIGSNLSRALLSSGHEIHIGIRVNSNIWRLEDIKNSLQIHYYEDISDRGVADFVKKIKPMVVVNAIGLVGKLQDNLLQQWESNFLSLIHLVNASLSSNVERLVHMGSSFEYGAASLKYRRLGEEVECVPVSEYGLAKLFETNYSSYLNRKEEIPVTVLRIFNVFGEYESKERLIPEVVLRAIDGKTIELHNPMGERDFIWIRDVTSAIIKIIDDFGNDDFNDIFNVGTGKSARVEDVAKIIVRETGVRSKIFNQGSDIRSENYIPGPIADISKIQRVVGWKPKYNLETAIRETVQWFKENRDKYKSIYQ